MPMTIENVELTFWNPPADGDKPSIDLVRGSFTGAGFDAEHVPDIPEPTAFRRACDGLRDKTHLIRYFKAGADLAVQIDIESEDGQQLTRKRVGTYRLAGSSVRPLDYSSDTDTHDKLRDGFRDALRTYTWSDVSKTLQSIFAKDGLGAYSPRAAGGVYFVPVQSGAYRMLDRIETGCNLIGMRFLRYAVPDTEAQRTEIREAIVNSLSADIDEQEAAIGEYTEDTRLEIFNNRKSSLREVGAQVIKLMGLLNGSASDLMTRLDVLTAKIDQLEQRSQNRVQPARRILMPGQV